MESQSYNSIYEDILRQAVIDEYYQELSALPTEEELATRYTFSEYHVKRMKKLFAKDRKHDFYIGMIKWGKTAAALFVVAFALLFGTLFFTSPEVRAAVKGVIIEWFETFTKFYSEDDKNLNDEEITWEISYFPKNFQVTDIIETNSITKIIMQNDQGEIISLTYMQNEGSASINNENVEYDIYEYEGMEFHIFRSKDSDKLNTIVWNGEEYCFRLSSSININELIKIAKSVIKI